MKTENIKSKVLEFMQIEEGKNRGLKERIYPMDFSIEVVDKAIEYLKKLKMEGEK